jgi:hypothetical protein
VGLYRGAVLLALLPQLVLGAGMGGVADLDTVHLTGLRVPDVRVDDVDVAQDVTTRLRVWLHPRGQVLKHVGPLQVL